MYININDIRERINEFDLIRLTDKEGTGAVDESRVTTAISDAEIAVKTSLKVRRYNLPLTEVPEIIPQICVALAIHNMYLDSPSGMPESREQAAATARNQLKKIEEGWLDDIILEPTEETESNELVIESQPRLFSRDRMKGY